MNSRQGFRLLTVRGIPVRIIGAEAEQDARPHELLDPIPFSPARHPPGRVMEKKRRQS